MRLVIFEKKSLVKRAWSQLDETELDDELVRASSRQLWRELLHQAQEQIGEPLHRGRQLLDSSKIESVSNPIATRRLANEIRSSIKTSFRDKEIAFSAETLLSADTGARNFSEAIRVQFESSKEAESCLRSAKWQKPKSIEIIMSELAGRALYLDKLSASRDRSWKGELEKTDKYSAATSGPPASSGASGNSSSAVTNCKWCGTSHPGTRQCDCLSHPRRRNEQPVQVDPKTGRPVVSSNLNSSSNGPGSFSISSSGAFHSNTTNSSAFPWKKPGEKFEANWRRNRYKPNDHDSCSFGYRCRWCHASERGEIAEGTRGSKSGPSMRKGDGKGDGKGGARDASKGAKDPGLKSSMSLLVQKMEQLGGNGENKEDARSSLVRDLLNIPMMKATALTEDKPDLFCPLVQNSTLSERRHEAFLTPDSDSDPGSVENGAKKRIDCVAMLSYRWRDHQLEFFTGRESEQKNQEERRGELAIPMGKKEFAADEYDENGGDLRIETDGEALAREIREEVGLVLSTQVKEEVTRELIGEFDCAYGRKYSIRVYGHHAHSGNLEELGAISDDREFSDLKWVGYSQCKDWLVSNERISVSLKWVIERDLELSDSGVSLTRGTTLVNGTDVVPLLEGDPSLSLTGEGTPPEVQFTNAEETKADARNGRTQKCESFSINEEKWSSWAKKEGKTEKQIEVRPEDLDLIAVGKAVPH